MKIFRNYKDSDFQDRVEKTYYKMLTNQTREFVLNMKEKYNNYPKITCNIWDTIENLENITDESDPDNDLPQIIHAYQTAISLENKNMEDFPIKNLFNDKEWSMLDVNKQNEYDCNITDFYNITDWDWLPLIGFIHDLGKVLLLKEYGSLEQWAVVGDTFPINQKLSESYIFENKKFHIDNTSLQKNTYQNNIGFENILMSWGHDEYLASILEKNNTKFPKEAIYLIRFHSFYSWHSPKYNRGYVNLANDFDWYMLPLLKYFQKSDLYSKCRETPSISQIKNKFKNIMDKYITNSTLTW